MGRASLPGQERPGRRRADEDRLARLVRRLRDDPARGDRGPARAPAELAARPARWDLHHARRREARDRHDPRRVHPAESRRQRRPLRGRARVPARAEPARRRPSRSGRARERRLRGQAVDLRVDLAPRPGAARALAHPAPRKPRAEDRGRSHGRPWPIRARQGRRPLPGSGRRSADRARTEAGRQLGSRRSRQDERPWLLHAETRASRRVPRDGQHGRLQGREPALLAGRGAASQELLALRRL